MTTREELQTKLDSLDETALQAVALFLSDRETKIAADEEFLKREAESLKLRESLKEFAEDWTEAESFAFEMGLKGFDLRSADTEANIREAKLFSRMLGGLSAEEKINALLDASQGRDPYVLACLRMVRTLTDPMSWEQERAFDVALMAQPWRKLERLERGELADFTLGLMGKVKEADKEMREGIQERNEQIQKENP